MRFHWAAMIAGAVLLSACSQSRTSLPAAATQQNGRQDILASASLGLQPYGRDLLLTEYAEGGIKAVAYSPYSMTGSKPDWQLFEYTFFISNTVRDPSSNAIFFSNYQEDIDSVDPFTGRRYREITLLGGSDEAIEVAVDHHGTVYGLMGERAVTPWIVGYAKGNEGGLEVPPTTTLRGPKTGLTSRPFAYSMAFDEMNELFVIGDGKIRVFAPPPNGDVPPSRVIEGSAVYPILEGTRSFSVDMRGDVAVIPKTRTSVVLYRASSRGDALPVKTLSGPHTALTNARFVVYCNTDTLWVLDRSSDGSERIMLYSAGWNGDMKPTRIINLPLAQGAFVYDMTTY
jgi:hypothetical protein